jgi:asparagine synthase (glutamine-hydrolysing)
MSVQAGVLHFDGGPVDQKALLNIGRTVAEFGPDGETTYFSNSLGMIYRPFHTTAESRAERQPFTFGSGRVMTWDGRLDNRDELLRLLGIAHHVAPTDVALAAEAYERWGADCFPQLKGEWALCLWDPRESELVLARDCIGVRQLFYYPKPGAITWCSYLAALVMGGTDFTICNEYIAGYLAFYPDAHLTPFAEIHSVPPGHFVRVRRGKTTVHSYWSLKCRETTRYKTDAEYEDHFRHLFRQAVRRRLRTDSPILAGLSGGYDSTSIVCMADDIMARDGLEIPKLDTFSYYDSNEPDDDDFIHVTKAEEKRGKVGFHCEMAGSGDSLSLEYPAFAAAPGFSLREEIKPMLSRVVEQHGYRVALSGTGGDEMNGQPLDFRIQMADLLVHFHPVQAAQQLVAWSLITRLPWVQLFAQSLAELLPLSVRVLLSKRGQIKPWIYPKFAQEHRMAARQLEYAKGSRFWQPSARDALQTVATLSRLVTHISPSVVEQRYPYLDVDLVEFLTSIPLDQLLRPGDRRSLMRRALAGLLPPKTLTRKTKAAAARCYSLTMQKHWDRVECLFHSSLSSGFGYTDRNLLREALLALKNGQVPPDFTRLLKALSLELWLRDMCGRGLLQTPSRASGDGDYSEFRLPALPRPTQDRDVRPQPAVFTKGGEQHEDLQQARRCSAG